MLNNLILELNNFKKIGIFGLGKEGKSFYNFAKKYLLNTEIIIIDKSNGKNYLNDLQKADLIIKSPGISLYNLNILYTDYNFTSMTELFLKYFSKQTIGITGTKGKSTLATILNSLLTNNNQATLLCGNIGVPAFDILDKITKDTQIVMELSSHQLLNIKYSPHISILINLFEEHLDYYESCKSYYDAKMNIFKYQDTKDTAIINFKMPNKNISYDIFKTKNTLNVHENELLHTIKFTIKNGFIHKSTLQILEEFIKFFDIKKEIYIQTLQEFKTLAHRLEYVQNINNIDFINDSISTIPEATIEAINILKNVNTLILGGYDRGIHYDKLVSFLEKSDVSNIILYSQTGKVLQKLFNVKNNSHIIYVKTLEEAVEYAFKLTKENSICLFSPAASSFDSYKNFEERGEHFKNMVKNYK